MALKLATTRFGYPNPQVSSGTMLSMTLLLYLACALVLLTLGADLLVRGAAAIARRLGVSSFFIGLTVVALGTSTPELFSSLGAAMRGQDDIAIGNVVGSNTFNIAVILGTTALICPIPVRVPVVRAEVVLVIVVATLPWLAAVTGGYVERWLGAAFMGCLLLYLWLGYRIGRRDGAAEALESGPQALLRVHRHARGRRLEALQDMAFIALGLGMLILGATLMIDSASAIARGLGASELVIGLTIVAGGTSVPELVTSIVAAFRKQPDLAVGNVLGSNVFNILGITGLTSLVVPQRISPQVLALDIPVMFAASLALLPIAGSGARISRPEGAVLLLAYVGYVAVLFTLARRWFE